MQAAAQLAYSRDKSVLILRRILAQLWKPARLPTERKALGCFVPKCSIWIATARRTSRNSLKRTSRCYWRRATSRLSSARWTSVAIKAFLTSTEENPFLGYRAVRIYPEFAGLFRTQLRAILRAASFGNAQLMIPMVHSLDQILWVKGELQKRSLSLSAMACVMQRRLRWVSWWKCRRCATSSTTSAMRSISSVSVLTI
ncbi:hypothetical protein DMH20_11580 [Escherichia coli]|nr:hypothetical protein [Escherichia coli]